MSIIDTSQIALLINAVVIIIMPMVLASDETYLCRLAPDLAWHGGQIIHAVQEAQNDSQGLAHIGLAIQGLLNYCLSQTTFRGMWFEDFCNGGVFHPIITVIDLIPVGYVAVSTGTMAEDWPWIHAMVREILIHECHGHYNPTHFGYSLVNLINWGVLYTHHSFDYPPGDISEEFDQQLDKWSNHLAVKVNKGDEYCHVDDPWYNDKYTEWEWIHNPDRQAWVEACNAQHEYDWAVMKDDEQEEYHSDKSSFDDEELSTDEGEAWSDDK
jgi:hypothetical protein